MAAASRKLLIRPAELRYGPASQPRFPPSLQLLQGLLRTEIGDQPGDALLFPSRRGGWPTVGELRWVFDPAATKAGVGRLVPHELRHTCASMGIKAGANIKVVQHLFGHSRSDDGSLRASASRRTGESGERFRRCCGPTAVPDSAGGGRMTSATLLTALSSLDFSRRWGSGSLGSGNC
jgi:hypothetical protein